MPRDVRNALSLREPRAPWSRWAQKQSTDGLEAVQAAAREAEALRLLAKELSNAEIASELIMKLARAISDANWGGLVRQLEYKAAWYGRTLVKIDKWYPTTKRCCDCGHVLDSLSLAVRQWACPGCGMRHDRDINAAKNILAAGLAVNACGEAVRPGRAMPATAGPDEAGIPRL
jgi:transposase